MGRVSLAKHGQIAIYAALAGNVAVALVKLGAFAVSGSSAMLVEAIHSLVDTLNQVLLLFGLYRGARPPDRRHPFGYGLEAYFWTFVVALLIFMVGGVASIYEGWRKLRDPTPIGHVGLTVAVLAVCLAFDIAAFVIGVRAAESDRPPLSKKYFPKITLAQSIHFSADPGVFEVLAEDGASILGLLIAFAGVASSAWLGWAAADGLAAVAIGMLLVLVAGVLVNETRSLLTAEAAAPSVLAEVDAVLKGDDRVANICAVQSMHLGPREILMAVTLDFRDDLTGPQLEQAADELSRRLRESDPRITRVFMRPGRAADGEPEPA